MECEEREGAHLTSFVGGRHLDKLQPSDNIASSALRPVSTNPGIFSSAWS